MRPGDASEENIQLFRSWVDLTQPTMVRRNQLTSGESVVPKLKWINSFAEIPCALATDPQSSFVLTRYCVPPAGGYGIFGVFGGLSHPLLRSDIDRGSSWIGRFR